MAEEIEETQETTEEVETTEETVEVVEPEVSPDNKVEKRIKELSNKVKLTSEERDELLKANEKIEAERDTAKKEVEFYSSFSDASDKYPLAKDFKDQIKEKVLSGYTVEDATVAVLASEGKLTATPQETESPGGGSATNPPAMDGPKSLNEMSREEKRAAVLDAIDKGEISL